MRTHWKTYEYRAIKPQEVAFRLYESARTKAQSRGLTFDLDFESIQRRVVSGRCEATGILFDFFAKDPGVPEIPFRASLDRLDNTEGYTNVNTKVVSKIYNTAKWSWGEDDVLRMAIALCRRNGYVVEKDPRKWTTGTTVWGHP